MKLLILHDELYPDTGANARIAYAIIDELLKRPDMHITILGRALRKGQESPYYKDCPVIHQPYLRYLDVEKWNKKKWKWLKYIFAPRSIFGRLSEEPDQYAYEAKKWVEKHAHEFDAILAFTVPWYTLSLAANVADKVPFAFYHMEPIYPLPPRFSGIYRESNEQVQWWCNRASRIFTTTLLKGCYDNSVMQPYIPKIRIVEFPNIRRRIVTDGIIKTIQLPENVCNVSFIGQLYPGHRDPHYLFLIFEKLAEKNIHFHILGHIQGKYPQHFYEKYFINRISNIHYHGEVSPFEADRIMMESDILVHIGNKDPMLLPSKILDYISAGKPILNFCQIHDCPTLSLLETYPMKMNIFTDRLPDDVLLDNVASFCNQNKGKHVDFEKVEKLYAQYTPKYAEDIIFHNLQELIKDYKSIKLNK